MADEIARANEIRVVKDGPRWLAVIGPDAQRGLVGSGPSAPEAVCDLMMRCLFLGWCFDDGWRPRGSD